MMLGTEGVRKQKAAAVWQYTENLTLHTSPALVAMARAHLGGIQLARRDMVSPIKINELDHQL